MHILSARRTLSIVVVSIGFIVACEIPVAPDDEHHDEHPEDYGYSVVNGDFTVRESVQIRRMNELRVRYITGDLIFDLEWWASEFEARIDHLRYIEGSLDLRPSGDRIVLVDLPALDSVEGGVFIQDNANFESLVAPELHHIRHVLRIENNDSIETIHLPNLSHAPNLIFEGNANLADIELPGTRWAHSLQIRDSPELRSLSVPVLEEIEEFGFVMERNESLDSFHLPALKTIHGDLLIQDNQVLETIEFAVLEQVSGDFQVIDNPNLPTSNAQQLANQVEVTGDTTISGNATD